MDNEMLLPERHPQKDFFIADVFDNLPFKDDIVSMEHPLYTLSKQKDLRVIKYEHGNIKIVISPSIEHGLPTIFDKDILLYCGSLLMDEVNKGNIPPKTIRISTHDLLVATNRHTNDKSYRMIEKSLERLNGVSITTNIKTNRTKQIEGFHLIERFSFIESNYVKRRRVGLEITLSDWFYNSILGKEVLTINPKYFRLKRAIERRLYEIARKHCGSQKRWTIYLDGLYAKIAPRTPLKKFRYNIRQIVATNHLPDYEISFSGDDLVTFTNRNYQPEQVTLPFTDIKTPDPILKTDTLEKARKIAPAYDKYWLKEEWLEFWRAKGCPPFEKNADAAFLGFCKAKHKENPTP